MNLFRRVKMNTIKKNKATSLAIFFQLITIFSLISVACVKQLIKKLIWQTKIIWFRWIKYRINWVIHHLSTLLPWGRMFLVRGSSLWNAGRGNKGRIRLFRSTVKNPSYREVCTEVPDTQRSCRSLLIIQRLLWTKSWKSFLLCTIRHRWINRAMTQVRNTVSNFLPEWPTANIAKSIIDDLNNEHVYAKPIVTQLALFTSFYKAEDYHQDYYNQNKQAPYCRLVIQPKLEKFEKLFKDRFKEIRWPQFKTDVHVNSSLILAKWYQDQLNTVSLWKILK